MKKKSRILTNELNNAIDFVIYPKTLESEKSLDQNPHLTIPFNLSLSLNMDNRSGTTSSDSKFLSVFFSPQIFGHLGEWVTFNTHL